MKRLFYSVGNPLIQNDNADWIFSCQYCSMRCSVFSIAILTRVIKGRDYGTLNHMIITKNMH